MLIRRQFPPFFMFETNVSQLEWGKIMLKLMSYVMSKEVVLFSTGRGLFLLPAVI